MKTYLVYLFLTVIVIAIFCVSPVMAQPPGPEPIPFDGFVITLLLAVAGLFGGKKVFDKHKKK